MINLNEAHRGGTMCLSKAGLAIGGTASIARTNAPNGAGIDFAINGLLYHLADADDNIAFTGLTQADLTTCLYMVCVSTAGALTVVQGTAVLTAALTAGTDVLQWPTPTAGTCAIGAIKLAMSGGAFTGGTTELSAATVTDTYYDFITPPSAPLTS